MTAGKQWERHSGKFVWPGGSVQVDCRLLWYRSRVTGWLRAGVSVCWDWANADCCETGWLQYRQVEIVSSCGRLGWWLMMCNSGLSFVGS